MGNSAGVAKSTTRDGEKPRPAVVGVIDLLSKEAERLDNAAQSAEAIENFIRATENSGALPHHSPKEDGQPNVVLSVASTVGKVSTSMDIIHEQMGVLQTSLHKFAEKALQRCGEMTKGNTEEVEDRMKMHIDGTNQLIRNTRDRLTTKLSPLMESPKNDNLPEEQVTTKKDFDSTTGVTSLTDTERSRYEKEKHQMKIIIDNLEDELESLKEECTKAVHSMDDANERMQHVEERVLDERLSHEVEVNSLRAIIERQDEIITNFNGGIVNDIWLENQKKRLFSKEPSEKLDHDTESEETCYDLIYVDQKSISRNKDTESFSTKNEHVKTKCIDSANYDSSSLASTRFASRNEVPDSEDTKSEVGEETETPSGVVLGFPYNQEVKLVSKDSHRIYLTDEIRTNQVNKMTANTDSDKEATVSETIETGESGIVNKQNILENVGNNIAYKERKSKSPQSVYELNNVCDIIISETTIDEQNVHTNITSALDIEDEQHEGKESKDESTKLETIEGETHANKEVILGIPGNDCDIKGHYDHAFQTDQTEDKLEDENNADKITAHPESVTQHLPKTPAEDIKTVNASRDDHLDQTTNTPEVVFTEESFMETREAEEELVLFDEGVTKEIIYKRSDGEVDGCLSYYKGVGAIIRTTVDKFGVDTVQCDVTDAVHIEMLPDLVEGERAVSFHIHVQKKYGADISKQETDFIKIFVPHREIPDHEEATLVCSVNGEDWEQCDLIDETPASLNDGIKVLGTELMDVDDVKLVAIAREKTVHLIGGEDDVTYQSQVDPSICVRMNTECFPARCGVTLMVHHSQQLALQSAVEIHKECRHIASCTAFVSLVCERMTTEDIYVVMALEPGTDCECKFTIFLMEDTGWKLADCDWNKTTQLLTIHLMTGAKKYRVIGLELPSDLSVEERLLAVHTLQQHTGHYTVRVVFRQKQSDPSQAVVICLRSNLVEHGLSQLSETGYSIGGLPSEPFCLSDGDTLTLECSGDVNVTPYRSKRMDMPFYSQKEMASKQLTLRAPSGDVRSGVKMFQGVLHVLKGKPTGYVVQAETIHMPVESC